MPFQDLHTVVIIVSYFVRVLALRKPEQWELDAPSFFNTAPALKYYVHGMRELGEFILVFVELLSVLILCLFTLIQDGISERLDNMGFLSEQDDFYSSMTPLSNSNVCNSDITARSLHHLHSTLWNSAGQFGFTY